MTRYAGLVRMLVVALLASCSVQAAEIYSFGVLPQRSPLLMAQYWNPILDYVSRKAGITLVLRVARTAPESSNAVAAGEYDFVYSNKIFNPKPGEPVYRVILKPQDQPICGQIVTLADSPIKSLADLAGTEIGFPSATAFVGYGVPMDYLMRKGIAVTPVFGGNQEGIMGQLRVGKVMAAGVNDQIMRTFAGRENVPYRVLWESAPYHNLPIAVHPRIPAAIASAVSHAFIAMASDAEGGTILAEAGHLVGQEPPYGLEESSAADYANYVEFYKITLVKEFR